MIADNRLADAGFSFGYLIVRNVVTLPSHDGLNAAKQALADSLRREYGGLSRGGFKALHPMDVNVAYYKAFGYSYHVLLQLESLVLKGKPLPTVSTTVEAMFMAELHSMLLTSGHDLAKTRFPLVIETAAGDEGFIGIGGKQTVAVAGDVIIRDAQGVIANIIHGPDLRTSITSETEDALFIVYAPDGIGEKLIETHLSEIETYLKIFSPQMRTQCKRVKKGPGQLALNG